MLQSCFVDNVIQWSTLSESLGIKRTYWGNINTNFIHYRVWFLDLAGLPFEVFVDNCLLRHATVLHWQAIRLFLQQSMFYFGCLYAGCTSKLRKYTFDFICKCSLRIFLSFNCVFSWIWLIQREIVLFLC